MNPVRNVQEQGLFVREYNNINKLNFVRDEKTQV